MAFKNILKQDENKRCLDSYGKVVKFQEKLNASVTMIVPELENVIRGKLYKIPYALKDNISTDGILTTACSKILANYKPVFNATVYDKLRKEGAVLISKANMDELAMGGTNLSSYYGKCYNPYDLKRISGGSSGGSAVLVSSGACAFSIGSDTGDSVRKPAGYNNIVGVKPTYGRISRYGVIPYASSLDHVAYFTNNVKDSAFLLEILAGRDDKDSTSSFENVDNYASLLSDDIRGKKILIFKNVIDSAKSDVALEIVKHFNNLVVELKNKGAIVEEVYFNNDLMRAIFPTYYIISNCEATANHANLDGVRYGSQIQKDSFEDIVITNRTIGFGTNVKKRFIIGSYGLYEENQEFVLKKAQKVRRLIVDEFLNKLKNADAIIAPASLSVAPLVDDKGNSDYSDEYLIGENHMVIGNFAGLPSITVPMGYVSNLPVGVNITANVFKESTMFNIAYAIENITGIKDVIKEDF